MGVGGKELSVRAGWRANVVFANGARGLKEQIGDEYFSFLVDRSQRGSS